MEWSAHWESPSNIALVKYWGKTKGQTPMNPSVSFTLSACKTNTRLDCIPGKNKGVLSFEFFYEGQAKPEFQAKILSFLQSLSAKMPWLTEHHLKIDSFNTFPHSAGIASSASAMSALALCLCSIDRNLFPDQYSDLSFLQKASDVSRMGSGSACRSLFPVAALWGSAESWPGSSDHFAISVEKEIHAAFKSVVDYIFLVSKSEKPVSSTAGHRLMEHHPYRAARIQQANEHLKTLMLSLQHGDWDSFADCCETEALSLHGLMMSSSPSYMLLEPESLRVISMIRRWRQKLGLPICFTIDAGPNIHVLFPKSIQSDIDQLIRSELQEYFGTDRLIKDELGKGPTSLV